MVAIFFKWLPLVWNVIHVSSEFLNEERIIQIAFTQAEKYDFIVTRGVTF